MIEYQNGVGFCFDNSTPPTPWMPSWVPIRDPVITTQLAMLGITGTNPVIFTPTVGSTCSYTSGGHTYDISVVNAPAPVAPAALPPPPRPQLAHTDQIKDNMLFHGNFYKFSSGELDLYLGRHNFDTPDVISKGGADGKLIADLATMYSSWGQGFQYDASKCQMWLKPNFLRMWLRCAKERKWGETRLCMHGMRSGQYEELGKDMSGFNFDFSQHGVKKWGFYCSASDHIASDYNGGRGTYPDGTAVIVLLLIKRNAREGSYEHYKLGSNRGGAIDVSVRDAYAVRDQMLVLTLGLAIAV